MNDLNLTVYDAAIGSASTIVGILFYSFKHILLHLNNHHFFTGISFHFNDLLTCEWGLRFWIPIAFILTSLLHVTLYLMFKDLLCP